ncbi:MAG TPA: helicase-related protein [Beijerinckiaceae bacterium]|nr:helicase-related protein [Beijerinckiaceae bacterium]
MSRRTLPRHLRARGVTAVLGPTNTGKTHLAIERMLGHDSGIIGLPLRLLAREVYQRVVERVGAGAVALVTGEEKIKPDNPRYWISTVEAMPRDIDVSFVAVDEVQLAADLDRGHVFTERLLNQRGRAETLLIGSGTMRPLIEALIPGAQVVTRPRLSKLTFAGEKKLSRLPPRSAIVAFSAEEVYAIAELIRRQRGGAAVVLGALSPRTRNAQVELFQSGDVDYLVATDAVGMGLNLDVDHVAFASDKKFDGYRFRKLFAAEFGQIAGRAGRHLRDGTFGSSGRCPPFEPELVEALEGHHFDPLRVLQWRNADLDFASLAALQGSLAEVPQEQGLTRAPVAEDVQALEIVAHDPELRDYARGAAAVERLWEVCQVPDYRKVSPAGHADLVGQLYRFLMRDGTIAAEWFSRHVNALDRNDGDIDALSNRIAQVRTWSFVANRPDWLPHPKHWQGVTRQVEDRLSDALHERLAQRFVDRRTSVLMRRLRENAMLEAEITATGDVVVEGQHVGMLHGFQFVPDPQAENAEAKTLRNVASKALAGEIEARAERFSAAADSSLVLALDGIVRWQGDPVAKLEPGEKVVAPRLRILADEQLTGPARDKVETRLNAWLKAYIVRLLGPAIALEEAPELTGIARGIGFQIAEALGVLERSKVLSEVRGLDQDGRGALRRMGVRFGAFHLYLPALLKPAPRTLATQLWALRNGGLDQKGIDVIAHLASSGRTSIPVDPEIAKGLYRAAGFRVCGARAVRVDILERLADLIRPAINYRPGTTPGDPPPGAADGEWFVPTPSMTSLVGCSGEDFSAILKSLGYASERRAGPAITVPLLPAAATTPAVVTPSAAKGEEAAQAAPGEKAATEQLTAETAETAETAQAPEAAADAAPEGAEPEPAESAEAAPAEPVALASQAAESAGIADEPVAGEAEAATSAAAQPPAAASEPMDAQEGAGTAGLEPSAEEGEAAGSAEPAAESGEAPAPEAPVLIEVWRLNRHHREGGQSRPPRGRGRPDHRSRGAEGEQRPGRDRRPRRDERPQVAQAGPPGEPAGAPPAQREARAPQRDGRPERRDDRRPNRGDRPNRDGRDNRPERRDGPRPSGQRPPPPERRERAPDPNSPFAKLAALKAQLESRDSDKG